MDLDLSCINVKQETNRNNSICDLLFNRTTIITNRSTSASHKNLSVKKAHGLKLTQSSKSFITQQQKPNLQTKKQGNRLKMSQIKERIMGIDCSKARNRQRDTKIQIISTNLKNQKATEINRNKFNQCISSFDHKISWKTPQLTYFIQNHNTQEEQQPLVTMRTQKNSRQSTDASTQLVFSMQISKNFQNETEGTPQKVQIPHWIQKIKSEKSLLATSKVSIMSSHNNFAENSRVQGLNRQIFDLRQVSSFTKTVSHHSTPSNQNFVLDQSMIEWTYETGFKNQVNE